MNLDKQDFAEVIKTKVLPVVAILAVVVIFFALVTDANKPVPSPQPAAAQSASANPEKDRGQQMARMQEIIQHSDGNWNHLSTADQQVLDGATGGHGRDALPMMVKQAKRMSKKTPSSSKAHP